MTFTVVSDGTKAEVLGFGLVEFGWVVFGLAWFGLVGFLDVCSGFVVGFLVGFFVPDFLYFLSVYSSRNIRSFDLTTEV